MKIAVPFANGEVFQHFGHTETFKLYEIEAGQVVSSAVIDTNGSGHDALAGFLSDLSVNVLLCGGIGGGAQEALSLAGIEICSGAQGDADAAVSAYLKGELTSAGVNCDHHDHDTDDACGGGCSGGCSGGIIAQTFDQACRKACHRLHVGIGVHAGGAVSVFGRRDDRVCTVFEHRFHTADALFQCAACGQSACKRFAQSGGGDDPFDSIFKIFNTK